MESEVVYLFLDDIIPNRFQPREIFDENSLKELAISIKEHGVIQPIIVRKVNNKYEIIAGERRYKASTMAGLTKIPAIIKNLDDKESSKVALIENLQRKDLTPIEEARTYQKILELETGMTQEGLAATMGKTQSAVSNKLRLLSLPDEVQDALLNEQISERHARSLLNVENKNAQLKLLERVIQTRMTVKELEKEIKSMGPEGMAAISNGNANSIDIEPLEEKSAPYQSAFSSLSLSPTEVDINKIKENAVDIGASPEEKPASMQSFLDQSPIKSNFMETTDGETKKDIETSPIAAALLNANGINEEKPKEQKGLLDSNTFFGLNKPLEQNADNNSVNSVDLVLE